MKTKEEIIGVLDWRPMGESAIYTTSHMEDAMEEYAKEVAINFKAWADANARLEDYRERRTLTDGELFDLYQQENKLV